MSIDYTGRCAHTTARSLENYTMPLRAGRPLNPYLRAEWKLSLHAATAAEVDLMLEDPLTRKPKYGARSKLVESLWTIGCRVSAAEPRNPCPPFRS